MERRYLFSAIAAFALITFCLSYLDIGLSYSDTYVWWDSLEHVLGGFTVALAALFVITLARIPAVTFFTMCAVLAVGLAWEIMEAHFGIGASPYMSYTADTIKDLICDCAGGYAAILVGRAMRHL